MCTHFSHSSFLLPCSRNELVIKCNSYLLLISTDSCLMSSLYVNKKIYLCFLCKVLNLNVLICTKGKDKTI